MNIGEVLKSKRWKILMGYVYGWGAAAVMVGALFKIQHWPYAGVMLTVGLLTEAFIFFLSAFEPPMELPDWAKVYPELKEDYVAEDEFENTSLKFDQILNSADITPELLSKVGKSLTDLTNTASHLSEISTATIATDMYVKNLTSASEAMNTFSEISNQANQNLSSSVDVLVESYAKTAQKISQTGNGMLTQLEATGNKFAEQIAQSGSKMAENYEKIASSMGNGLNGLETTSKAYSEKLTQLNKNLELLNSNYENQLKGTTEQLKASQKFFEDLGTMNQVISTSLEEIKKYKSNAEQLNAHLESLNSIYGNMLGAMNYKKKN